MITIDRNTQKLVAAVAVTAVALAGALRFIAERLALDAEAPRYAEARATFERAQQQLVERRSEISGMTSPAHPVLHELGRKALEESESWLRAHRVRRLVPLS